MTLRIALNWYCLSYMEITLGESCAVEILIIKVLTTPDLLQRVTPSDETVKPRPRVTTDIA